MPRFAKQSNCLSSDVLASFAANLLSPLARQGVGLHLRSCDFCAAESRLHECAPRERAFAATAFESADPPVPLALRLFAESRLADIAAASARPRRHAA